MAENYCPQCGAANIAGSYTCKYCGEPLTVAQRPAYQPQPAFTQTPVYQQQGSYPQPSVFQQQGSYPQPSTFQQQGMYPQPQVFQQQGTYPQPYPAYESQPVPYPNVAPGINPTWPVKSKTTAGVLAILLGGVGVHKFYLGKVGLGILYLVLCWTYVPAIIALIEGIIYLCSSDYNFQIKNKVRIS